MRPMPPIMVVDLFPETRRELLALLAGLSEREWDAPTACAGWSVKDVALHLLGGDLGNLSRRRDGLDGALLAYAPPDANLTDESALAGAIDRWNVAWGEATRRLSTRVIRELLAETGEATHAHYRTLNPLALGGPVSWAGPDPAPVWLDIAREYTEQWAHQAQIRDATDRPGLMERRIVAPVLATFIHALPHALRGLDRPDGARLRVVITGEAGGAWMAARQGGRWVLGIDAGEGADATATLDQDDAWRLFTKGLTREAAERAVRLEGDRALAGAVLAMVAIIA